MISENDIDFTIAYIPFREFTVNSVRKRDGKYEGVTYKKLIVLKNISILKRITQGIKKIQTKSIDNIYISLNEQNIYSEVNQIKINHNDFPITFALLRFKGLI